MKIILCDDEAKAYLALKAAPDKVKIYGERWDKFLNELVRSTKCHTYSFSGIKNHVENATQAVHEVYQGMHGDTCLYKKEIFFSLHDLQELANKFKLDETA